MTTNWLDKIKLFFRKDKELYLSLYEILGFYPHRISLYQLALSHKSKSIRNEKGKLQNNERLEFLGDAVIEAVISDAVYHHFEGKREGFLTTTRSKVVQRETLNKLSSDLGLDRLIRSSSHSTAHNNYMGGNAFEALVGAIYLDRGYSYCMYFLCERILGNYINLDRVAYKEVNFKSKLLEWSQKNRINISFELCDADKPVTAEAPVFKTEVLLEGLSGGNGSGYSKKESQQVAAKEALQRLRREPQFIESVFRSKEKRTAMEEEAYAVLPALDEGSSAVILVNTSTEDSKDSKKDQPKQESVETPSDDKGSKNSKMKGLKVTSNIVCEKEEIIRKAEEAAFSGVE